MIQNEQESFCSIFGGSNSLALETAMQGPIFHRCLRFLTAAKDDRICAVCAWYQLSRYLDHNDANQLFLIASDCHCDDAPTETDSESESQSEHGDPMEVDAETA